MRERHITVLATANGRVLRVSGATKRTNLPGCREARCRCYSLLARPVHRV